MSDSIDRFSTIRKKTTFIRKTANEIDGELEEEEGDVRELIRNLWAFRGWTNKDYLVDQVLEDGIENVRTQFQQAFYETEDVAEKFDVLNENVNMLGPASETTV